MEWPERTGACFSLALTLPGIVRRAYLAARKSVAVVLLPTSARATPHTFYQKFRLSSTKTCGAHFVKPLLRKIFEYFTFVPAKNFFCFKLDTFSPSLLARAIL